MDYLDPKKRFRHHIIMMVGYVLIGLAILISTVILLQMAYGYGRGKDGQIIQNGFVFLSSQPHPAQIYVDNKLNKARTNTRLTLPGGNYKLQLKRDGYRDWKRTVTVLGGDVQHFDYPLLLPKTLATSTVRPYAAAPVLSTQSPDQRWLLVLPADSFSTFDMYDLKDPTQAPRSVAVPPSLIGRASGGQSWQVVEWANDNDHVLLQHTYDDKTEFIEVDRTNPESSVNLNDTLSVAPSSVSLNNKKYDQYYVYDAGQHTLQKTSLKTPALTPYLDHVLAYKSYSDDTVLYATDTAAPAGQVYIKMQVGSKQYAIKTLPAGGPYLLDMAGYSGSLYAVAGSGSDGKIYIYKDPVKQLNAQPKHVAVPQRVLRVANTSHIGFSSNTQFVLAENGSSVATFDIENVKSYNYTLAAPLDAPQTHVAWMDGHRLVYASGGKLVIVDYDNTNQQTVMPMSPAHKPFFAPDMKHVFALTPTAADQNAYDLTQTALLIPTDL